MSQAKKNMITKRIVDAAMTVLLITAETFEPLVESSAPFAGTAGGSG